MFFAELDLQLFSDNRKPPTIHPNAFLLEECSLVEVPDAFIDPQSLQPGTKGHGYVHQKRTADPSLRALIRNRGQTDRIHSTFYELQAITQRMSKSTNDQMRQLSEETDLTFLHRISQAEALGEQERAQRLRRFATLQKYGHRLLQYLDEYDNVYRYGSGRLENLVPWNEASFALQRVAQKLLFEASQGLLRDACLMNLRVMRAARRERRLNVMEAAKFRRWRIRTVKAWTEQKRSSRQTRELGERMLKTGELDDQALAYFADVAQVAYQSLLKEVAWQDDGSGARHAFAPIDGRTEWRAD